MIKRSFFVLFLVAAFWLNSCKIKDSEIDYNPNVGSSKDYIRAEDAVFEIVNSFYKGVRDTAVNNHGTAYIDACSVWMYPALDSMVFDYGGVDRYCQDNKFRRGHFNVKFDGNIFDVGVTADLNTDSLLVDDLPVETHMRIKSLGLNSDNFYEYSIQVLTSSFYEPDTMTTNIISITTDYLMAWTEGWQTPGIHEDDKYLVTGTANGLSRYLTDFTVLIQEPLVNMPDCWWIASGLSQITVPTAQFQTGTIDYITDDGCNNKMNFYFNGNLFFEQIK
jgi:hypothetical protein